MASDLISRDAMNEMLDELCVMDFIYDKLNELPTVDAAPVVHGEWRLDLYTAKYGNPYCCSECREEYGDTYNYCPNCGAKMDGDKE